jgi:uncharacterized LabA/DUF88 family protein
MKKAVLLIDGENFQFKVEDVLKSHNFRKTKEEIAKIKLKELIKTVIKKHRDISLQETFYYSAKLHYHQESPRKSNELINAQRILKRNLSNQGIGFTIAGNVRLSIITSGGKKKLIFREKGVDVQIAVDMISFSQQKNVDTIILLSSDSDLQPAVKKVRQLGKEVIYMGFKYNPNMGLIYTTNRNFLITDAQVVRSF